MVSQNGQSVKWSVKYSVTYGRDIVIATGVDGNNAVAFVNGDGWQVEFWNGGFAGLLSYRSLTDAAKDMQRWCNSEMVHELFMVAPPEEEGIEEGTEADLNAIDEFDEWWARIEPIMRAEEALERVA